MSWYSDGERFDEYEGCSRCNFYRNPSAYTCKNCSSGDYWNYEDWELPCIECTRKSCENCDFEDEKREFEEEEEE